MTKILKKIQVSKFLKGLRTLDKRKITMCFNFDLEAKSKFKTCEVLCSKYHFCTIITRSRVANVVTDHDKLLTQ